ncbi:MAG: serine hydroxymethyltransferase [Neisseriaceae bacterium]
MYTNYKEKYHQAIENLEQTDEELLSLLVQEDLRQQQSLLMIAASSIAFDEVLAASASNVMNVTLEGYVGHRFHGGTKVADKIETLAIERAKKIFKAQYVNVQPLSCSIANYSILFSFLAPGDTILSLSLSSGGHLTHGAPVSISGKYFNIVNYRLNQDGYIDYENVEYLAKLYRPKIIIAGASAYTRLIDYKRFREIADQVESFLLADISHISGLVAAGIIPSPIDYAHFTTTSTYKQLYGPHGGLICMGKDANMIYQKKKLSVLVDHAIFPMTQGTPDMSIVAAKAASFKKIDSLEFKLIMEKVVKYSKLLADLFIQKNYKVLTGGTDNHMIIIDILISKGLTGVIAEKALEKCNIIINKNIIPNDTKSAFITSGIRLGTNSIAIKDSITENTLTDIVDLIDHIFDFVKPIDDKQFTLDDEIILSASSQVKDWCE